MRHLAIGVADDAPGGAWQVFVSSGGGEKEAVADVTFFRGAPTDVVSLGSADPFGPTTAELRFPAVTLLDRKGTGDMWWCLPEVDVDICWVVEDVIVYAWEGFIVSFDYGGEGLSVTCQGAMYQLDHYLAKPEFLYSPMPFEHAIMRQFENRTDSRLSPARVVWPAWWELRYYPDPLWARKPWLQPSNVVRGQFWSGMVTRSTGQWTKVLTGYIQELLGSMQTDLGQFTLMLEQDRTPVLMHRDRRSRVDVSSDLMVNLLTPGVDVTLSEDHSQKLNSVFVTGRSLSGVRFSGMYVSNDGTSTGYRPAAARRDVWPPESNPWLDNSMMLREVQLSAAEGMSEGEAARLARSHLQRYMHPGFTGSITLSVDPTVNGLPFPRQAIRAGRMIGLRNVFGRPHPLPLHITEVSVSAESTTLTVDSLFRDRLTVDEVRLRGRDALTPTRMLTTGQWQPHVADQLFPWSYDMGAGYVPKSSQALFRGIDSYEEFPWRNWVRAHPPKDPQWRDRYIRIGPRDPDVADRNWSAWLLDDEPDNRLPHPVLLSAAGQAKLVEVAAYDRDGNVLPVSFHFSLWNSNSVNALATPVIGTDEQSAAVGYPIGQHHPFFPDAWEQYDSDGVMQNPLTPQAEASASLITGWGNGYERAGFWPRDASVRNVAPTGLFRDESQFSWDLTSVDGTFVNPEEPADVNVADPSRATVYALVYCEDQGDQEVFFLGRIYRAEPGEA